MNQPPTYQGCIPTTVDSFLPPWGPCTMSHSTPALEGPGKSPSFGTVGFLNCRLMFSCIPRWLRWVLPTKHDKTNTRAVSIVESLCFFCKIRIKRKTCFWKCYVIQVLKEHVRFEFCSSSTILRYRCDISTKHIQVQHHIKSQPLCISWLSSTPCLHAPAFWDEKMPRRES